MPTDAALEFPRVVPVINENDSVAIEELRYGDNDKLSSRVARLWPADLLILLTSVPGLMEGDSTSPIPEVSDVESVLSHVRDEKGNLSVGGMASKLRAVQDAVGGGVECIIASGRHAEQIPELVRGGGVCTRFRLPSSATA